METTKSRFSVASLLSPPEMRSESFGSSMAHAAGPSPYSSFNSTPPEHASQSGLQAATNSNRKAYASPPISHCNPDSPNNGLECPDESEVRDPQLFVPHDTANSVAPDEPLFPQESTNSAAQDVINRHMKSSEFAQLESKPAREDYELAVSFVSTVFDQYNKNPSEWFRQERERDKHYGRPSGVQKRPAYKKLAPAPTTGPRRQKVPLPPVSRAPRAPKRTPKSRALDSFDGKSSSASPKPAKPAPKNEDLDFTALPDYSPSLETLPKGNSKCLKSDWSSVGLPIAELATEPNFELLHEAEVNLASSLRLHVAPYLCSKRRIFQARLDALKIGKAFRKTDAQQACRIDVNKASKLWAAYDKVGWFKPEHFKQFV